MNYSNESESEIHSAVSASLWPHEVYSPRNSLGQNTGVGSLSLLQRIFPTQESNECLLNCRWILYQLSYQVSPVLYRGCIIKLELEFRKILLDKYQKELTENLSEQERKKKYEKKSK